MDETWHSGRVDTRIGNEACGDRSVTWLMRGGPKSEGRSKIFTHLHSSLCILVSNLEIDGQIIHQSICLDELNSLQLTAKLCVQRFGGKFKKCVSEEEHPYIRKSNSSHSDDIDIDRFRLTR